MNTDQYKTYAHNPPHLFIANAKYWVSASAYSHNNYFKKAAIKTKMIEILQIGRQKYNWTIDD